MLPADQRFDALDAPRRQLQHRLILDEQLPGIEAGAELPPELVPIPIGGQNQGFGLGFAVSMGEHAGTYRWLGITGTYFWIDPSEDLIVFAWNQLRPNGAAPIERIMSDIVYEAILD